MFSFPSKISLARIPTPITCGPRLSEEWKIDIRVKNDNLTETEISGNKVRKLEYLLADALRQKCDTIITCGAVTSNHARATAIASRRLGLDTLLVLAGEAPSDILGNLQLDLLVGARVFYVSWPDYTQNIDTILETQAEHLRQQGKKPYVIPTGGSNAIGLLGYVEAIQEMKIQSDALPWKPDYVICAVGSGGTYSGLFLGNELYSYTKHVTGILVCGTVEQFRKKIIDDVRESCRMYTSPFPDFSKIELLNGYYGSGYAKTNSEQMRFIRHVAEMEGMILDPVYTGKAFYGLNEELKKGYIPQNSKVLFIHTGGIYGLSAFASAMREEWPDSHYWKDNLE